MLDVALTVKYILADFKNTYTVRVSFSLNRLSRLKHDNVVRETIKLQFPDEM